MANVVVVGSQWGDEGKGKIVDWLSEQADIVVRFQGGHNAGHTLVIDGITYKLSLLPSGVVRQNKWSVVGNGVVLEPRALGEESERLKGQGVAVTPDNLRIAENVTLILPLHRDLDSIRESASALTAIGTTRRGIGPAYEDKVARRGLRVADLPDLFITLPGTDKTNGSIGAGIVFFFFFFQASPFAVIVLVLQVLHVVKNFGNRLVDHNFLGCLNSFRDH